MVRTRSANKKSSPQGLFVQENGKERPDNTSTVNAADPPTTKRASRCPLLIVLPVVCYVIAVGVLFVINTKNEGISIRSLSEKAFAQTPANTALIVHPTSGKVKDTFRVFLHGGGGSKVKPRTKIKDRLRGILQGANVLGMAQRDDSSAVTAPKEKKKKKKKFNVHFKNAHTGESGVSPADLAKLRDFSHRVQAKIPDISARGGKVLWGGSQPWWTTSSSSSKRGGGGDDLDDIDGGNLLWNYFVIMTRYMKDFDNARFPFKLCKSEGCAAEQSIEHTLEWREKYQPWYISPAMKRENAVGWVYHRGFSPPAPLDTAAKKKKKHSFGRHAMLWLRPGQHYVVDDLTYFRCILHSADKAIAESLRDSNGHVGKFNVLIDGADYSWSKMPDLRHMKQAVVMLQDHYPNRLGMIFLVNMSRSAEFVVTLIKPIITKEVRMKIHILSHNVDRRDAELESFIEPEYLPTWLGGTDKHEFNADEYYPKKFNWSDRESTAFLKTMPYHGA